MSLQKIAAEEALSSGLRCSFCGAEPADGSALVSGADSLICDECVSNSADLLASDEDAPPRGADIDEGNEGADAQGGARRGTFFRLLTEHDVAALVSIDDLIDAMEVVLRRFSAGEVVQPVRTVIEAGAPDRFFAVMPAFVPPALGAKLVTVFNSNEAAGLPTHLATVLLFSSETGALVAILDGRYITELRTAAVSAVSARLLARDDASVLAIIGSGVQARSHLAALERVFELSQVRVWSRSADHQLAFIEEMQPHTEARIVGCDSAEDAVRIADLVVLATSSRGPVVESDWIKAGAHVISVGACRPDQREMDPALVKRGRLFVDSRAAATSESGDVLLGIQERLFTASHIVGELGELIAGAIEGRRSPRDVTIFKSLGLAVEDVVAAQLAYQRAMTRDVGRELEL